MKKTYFAPALRVYQVKLHNHLCMVSGNIEKNSFDWEGEEDLDS